MPERPVFAGVVQEYVLGARLYRNYSGNIVGAVRPTASLGQRRRRPAGTLEKTGAAASMAGMVQTHALVAVVAAGVLMLAFCTPTLARTAEYQVYQSPSDRQCRVYPADVWPPLGRPLAASVTIIEACNDAKGLHSDDPGARNRCLWFAQNTKKVCNNHGINLP
jgi:hypothetical protein